MSTELSKQLDDLLNGQSLTEQQAYNLMHELAAGEMAPALAGAFLAGLRAKGENAEEIGKITDKLIEGSVEAVKVMSECASRVDDNVKGSTEASESIQGVNDLIEKFSLNTSSVAAATEEHSAMSATISDSAKKLSELTNLQVESIEHNMNELLDLQKEACGLHNELKNFEA